MNKIVSIFCFIFLAPIVNLLLIKKVKNKNNLPDRNFILASNHQSYLDIIASGYICVPRKYTFIGQVDKGQGIIKFLRDFVYFLAGVIRLNRYNEDSKKDSVANAIKHLKNNYSLIIYPEGTRTLTGEIQKGKWGIAKLFLQTEVPIVPMGISGAFELFPPKGKLKIKRKIILNIGKPLYFKKEIEESKKFSSDSEEYKNICISITDKVMEEIKKLTYED